MSIAEGQMRWSTAIRTAAFAVSFSYRSPPQTSRRRLRIAVRPIALVRFARSVGGLRAVWRSFFIALDDGTPRLPSPSDTEDGPQSRWVSQGEIHRCPPRQ